MIEVYKTNVKSKDQANKLVRHIHKTFMNSQANFDLEDCDKILRVKSNGEFIQPSSLIHLVKSFGYDAEVLPG
jgi:uncharacterized protein YqkB